MTKTWMVYCRKIYILETEKKRKNLRKGRANLLKIIIIIIINNNSKHSDDNNNLKSNNDNCH